MGILENAKGIAEAVHEIQNLDLYKRVLALHSDIIGLVEDNLKLRNELTDLKKKVEIKGQIRPIFDDDLVYYLEQDNNKRDGPYCHTCWDIDNKLVRVTPYGDGTHYCNFCASFRPRNR